MRTVRMELLRPDEILKEKERFSVVYLPVGPMEWHGPHLPLGTDPLNAEAVARRVAEKIGGVVMPTFFWGTEMVKPPEKLKSIGFDKDERIFGMDYPANSMKSFYVPEEPFASALREYLKLLVNHEYKLIVIVNGHGGRNHVEAIKKLAYEFTTETENTVLYIMALGEGKRKGEVFGHATCAETSIITYLFPDSVDIGTLPVRGTKLYNTDFAIVDEETFKGNPTEDFSVREDPRDSTTDYGKDLLYRAIESISKTVLDTWGKLEKNDMKTYTKNIK